MTTNTFTERLNDIRTIQRQHTFFYQLLAGVFVTGVLIGLGFQLFVNDTGYPTTNLYTEAVSIAVTVFILRLWDERDERRRHQGREIERKRDAEEDLKQQLVMDAGSLSNEKALDAMSQMYKREWLMGQNGLLKSGNLAEAKLSGASLRFVNLEGANLIGARLDRCNFFGANLPSADLSLANLLYAGLEYQNLSDVKLHGANLTNANLYGENLETAKFNEHTILPDGTNFDETRDQDEQLHKFVSGKWYNTKDTTREPDAVT